MKKRILLLSLVGLTALALPAAGLASSLSIFMTGLNLTYDGLNIQSVDSGNASYPGADALITSQFVQDGSTLLGTSVASYADVYIGGVTGLLSTGSTTYSTGFPGHGFDLYFDDLGGWLDLDWDSAVEVEFNNLSGELSVHGSAVTSSLNQSLPLGLALGTPVEVTFSQQLTSYEVAAGAPLVTSFKSFGTGEITGPSAVPEPGTLFLLGAGLAGGIAARRRRRQG